MDVRHRELTWERLVLKETIWTDLSSPSSYGSSPPKRGRGLKPSFALGNRSEVEVRHLPGGPPDDLTSG